MMHRILASSIAIVCAASVFATPPVFTKKKLEEARKQAVDEKKLLIVDSMADWCPPCKQMDKTTWVDPKVVAWMKDNAVAFQFDVDAERKLAEEFAIEAMPTMIVFKEGKEIDRSVGYLSPADMLAWMADVKAGKTKADALKEQAKKLREKAGDRVGKDGKVDIQERMTIARELSRGEPGLAAEEYEWLWNNMLEHEPAMVGVRLSFMVNDMQRLAAKDVAAKKRFTVMRDAVEKKADADKDDVAARADWVALNEVLRDDDRTLAWYDRVKDDGDSRPQVERTTYNLQQLFKKHKRWADLGRMSRDPMGDARQATMMLSMNMGEGEEREQMKEFAQNHARSSISDLYAGLLAAGREKDADKVAGVLLKSLDDAASRRALVSAALEAGQAKERHLEMLDKADAASPDDADAGLRRKVRDAVKK